MYGGVGRARTLGGVGWWTGRGMSRRTGSGCRGRIWSMPRMSSGFLSIQHRQLLPQRIQKKLMINLLSPSGRSINTTRFAQAHLIGFKLLAPWEKHHPEVSTTTRKTFWVPLVFLMSLSFLLSVNQMQQTFSNEGWWPTNNQPFWTLTTWSELNSTPSKLG